MSVDLVTVFFFLTPNRDHSIEGTETLCVRDGLAWIYFKSFPGYPTKHPELRITIL